MIDLASVVTTISYVQREMIKDLGEGTKRLDQLHTTSRADAVRTLKSLFFLVDRRLNARLSSFTYRLNDDGLAVLEHLRHQRTSMRYG